MPRFFFRIFILICPITAIASTHRPEYVSPGHSGLEGVATSMLEIKGSSVIREEVTAVMPCYSTVEQIVSSFTPQMYAYTRLDTLGNMVWQQWFTIVSISERYRVPNHAKPLTVIATAHIPDTSPESFHLWDDARRQRKMAMIITEEDGTIREYITLGYEPGENEPSELIYHDVVTSSIFRNLWEHDGQRLVSTRRETDGKVDSEQLYTFKGNSTRMISSEMILPDGGTASRIRFDRKNRMRRMTIYPGNAAQYSYKYKYSDRADTEDYTYEMIPVGKGHSYYSYNFNRVCGGRVTYSSTLTATGDGTEKGRLRKLRKREMHRAAHSITYNDRGDYTGIFHESNPGFNTRVSYLYDPRGNWYVMHAGFINLGPEDIQTTLRSINYRDK